MTPLGAAAAILAAAAVAGCALSPPLAAGLPRGAPRAIELDATPFFPQEAFHCGPAALATLLRASGAAVTPEALAPQVFIPGRRGSLQLELIGATRRHGRLPYVLGDTAHGLVAELEAGRPVLVLQNLGSRRAPAWHYAVLIGYDAARNVAILRSGRERRLEMRWQRFAGTWHRGGRFAMTTLRPGVLPAHADAGRYLTAAAGLEAAGRARDAALAFAAAVARWPGEPHAWLGFGNAALADGAPAEAAERYARAVVLAPADAAARNNLAEALSRSGCGAEAERQLERAAELAAGTALEAAVSATRAEIEARPPEVACRIPPRDWPD